MLQYVAVLHSFVLQNSIPLSIYTTFCLPTFPLMDIWVVSTLGLLWTKLLWISESLLLLGIYPEVKLLDYMVILYSIYLRNHIPFSTTAAPFYIPTSNTQGFQFLHILNSTSYFLFDNSHSNGVVSHCGFDLHFSND